MKKLNVSNVTFAAALPCVSSAAKFTVRIPALSGGGEPLVYPADHEKAGQPILDWQDKPIGEAGIVFLNAKDNKVQAALGDGSAIIIVNEVDEAGADLLAEKLLALNPDPESLTLEQLKEWLAYAHSNGFVDTYNSDTGFHAKNFTPLGARHHSDPHFGRFKRDSRDLCSAVYAEGEVEFADSNGSEGKFTDGAVILKQGDSVRAIEPETFLRTYRTPANEKIELEQIPVLE